MYTLHSKYRKTLEQVFYDGLWTVGQNFVWLQLYCSRFSYCNDCNNQRWIWFQFTTEKFWSLFEICEQQQVTFFIWRFQIRNLVKNELIFQKRWYISRVCSRSRGFAKSGWINDTTEKSRVCQIIVFLWIILTIQW